MPDNHFPRLHGSLKFDVDPVLVYIVSNVVRNLPSVYVVLIRYSVNDSRASAWEWVGCAGGAVV